MLDAVDTHCQYTSQKLMIDSGRVGSKLQCALMLHPKHMFSGTQGMYR